MSALDRPMKGKSSGGVKKAYHRSVMTTDPLSPSVPPRPPLLSERVRTELRARHYSLRTEDAYVGWVRRYVRFCGRRHPRETGREEINAFLSRLATDDKVSASTQNQALSALLFLYRVVLGGSFPD